MNIPKRVSAALILFAVFALAPKSYGSLNSEQNLDINRYKGQKVALVFYSIDDPRAPEALALMNELYAIRGEYNFAVVGLCVSNSKPDAVEQFNRENNVAFPAFLDHDQKMSMELRMRGTIGLCIFNKKGKRMSCKWGAFIPPQPDLTRIWRTVAARFLGIGHVPEDMPVLGILPRVPHFSGTTIDGRTVDIRKAYNDKPVIIVIFSPKCSHCRKELAFLNTLYTGGDLHRKFEIIAVSRGSKKMTSEFITKKKYTFPVLLDAGHRITSRFPSFTGSIPLSYFINRSGEITSIQAGFGMDKAQLYIMRLRKLAGLKNPPLLSPSGYSGERACIICHEKEHIQWSLTRHADAFASLVRKGQDDDPACVNCHVTGFGREGGYSIENRKTKHLTEVQCESCHGPGYESCSAFTDTPRKMKLGDWKKVCATCHTEKESINFVFSKRYKRILHRNAPDLSSMDRDERLAFVRKFREKKNLFDNPAHYTGAESCRECHRQQYSHWKDTTHAATHQSPSASSAKDDTLYRYHTGVNMPGGYPEPGMEGVQCEACHGPGEKHIKNPDARGQEYIIGLGSQCSSCVVEQICRTCHSPQDDPDFVFEDALKKVGHPNKK